MASNALESKSVSDLLYAVRQTDDIAEIISVIKQIGALKVALEAVDKFREQSIIYAKLEAEALVRCVELGGLNELAKNRKKCAAWLAGMPPADRDRYIAMCADGMTIDNVWKREIGDSAKFSEIMDELEAQRKSLVAAVKENGIVSIKEFSELAYSKLTYTKKSLASDMVDGLRNRLRSAGAVGVGDDEQTYVMPTPKNNAAVKEAVLLRYESICNDFKSIRDIVRASELSFSYREFDSGRNWSYESNPHIPHLLIALCVIGAINDENAMLQAISKSDLRQEMDYAKKTLKLSREQVIRAEYAALERKEDDS